MTARYRFLVLRVETDAYSIHYIIFEHFSFQVLLLEKYYKGVQLSTIFGSTASRTLLVQCYIAQTPQGKTGTKVLLRLAIVF